MLRSIQAFAAVLALLSAFAVVPRAHAAPAAKHRHYRPVRAEQTGNVFTFGVRGGNIRPWSVTIDASGIVTPTVISVRTTHLNDPADTVAALVTLANAGHVFSLPSFTACAGVLPDIATSYITINTPNGPKSVSYRGNCNRSFAQLWAVLTNLVGLSF